MDNLRQLKQLQDFLDIWVGVLAPNDAVCVDDRPVKPSDGVTDDGVRPAVDKERVAVQGVVLDPIEIAVVVLDEVEAREVSELLVLSAPGTQVVLPVVDFDRDVLRGQHDKRVRIAAGVVEQVRPGTFGQNIQLDPSAQFIVDLAKRDVRTEVSEVATVREKRVEFGCGIDNFLLDIGLVDAGTSDERPLDGSDIDVHSSNLPFIVKVSHHTSGGVLIEPIRLALEFEDVGRPSGVVVKAITQDALDEGVMISRGAGP